MSRITTTLVVVATIYLVVFAVVGGSGGRCGSGAVHVVEIASR